MRTIIFKQIDEHKIITGFGELQVDSVKTREVTTPIFQECAEFLVVHEKQIEFGEKEAIRQAAQKSGNTALYNSTSEEMAVIQSELVPLVKAMNERAQQIFTQNAVYFSPSGREILVDNDTLAILMQSFNDLKNQPGKKLDIDGNIIYDNRGVRYYEIIDNRWVLGVISKLGNEIPEGGKLETDLSEQEKQEITDQVETEMIAGLSASDKELAKNTALDAVLSQSVQMRNELEIKGDAEALSKSQAWYQEQVTVVEEKYA